MAYRKKLIEVALPLEAINKASAREKSIRHGHPSTLHLWWARRPLATARAVIFAQMVDDPSAHPDLFKTEKAQEKERQRLFKIIEDLVIWENTTNEEVLQKAREEIWQSWRRACAENADHPKAKELFDRNKLPAFLDPFAGGGSLPLEAQRLGLEAYASDLNPVAVLINKAMIEIPPKFSGNPPVNPEWQKKSREEKTLKNWKVAQGLAADVNYYGQWMRDEAEKRIGQLYPKIKISEEMVKRHEDLKPYLGKKMTIIAWIWARTVKSPNPAFRDIDVPLASTFILSTKVGKEVYVEPVVKNGSYDFIVRLGKPKDFEAIKHGTKLSRGANFKCIMSGAIINDSYIKAESMAKRMGVRLMAIVAEGQRGRLYLDPTPEHEKLSTQVSPTWKPDQAMNRDTRDLVSGRGYGFFFWADLFTSRQLLALNIFSDLVKEARDKVKNDGLAANLPDDGQPLCNNGLGAQAYADAIALYLAFTIDRLLQQFSTLSVWSNNPAHELVVNAFGRQALPMTWDFGEINPFCEAASWEKVLFFLTKAVRFLCEGVSRNRTGMVIQADAQSLEIGTSKVVSTDPPYYDNIGYADLSDFFYVWLRRSLHPIFPNLFSTLTVPKAEELVAATYRHGSKEKAEAFFLEGMTKAMQRLAEQSHPDFPVTIYYAFKQSENDGNSGIASTGWETFLNAIIRAGFAISGTWPIHTEKPGRMVAQKTNSLTSSIVLVCRKRPLEATMITRRDFLNILKMELPTALTHLQRGNIAPVDFAQAAIGPGMAVYCRFKKVIEADGSTMSVCSALQMINQELDIFLAQQEESMDADTRFCLIWFEQYGNDEGPFGEADVLSRAKNTSIQAMADDEIIKSKAGKVRLIKRDELKGDWDPEKDKRLTDWECTQHLIRRLSVSGEEAAAKLVAQLGGGRSEEARALAYRLYSICEKKKWTQDALDYNSLVIAWPEIMKMALAPQKTSEQGRLF